MQVFAFGLLQRRKPEGRGPADHVHRTLIWAAASIVSDTRPHSLRYSADLQPVEFVLLWAPTSSLGSFSVSGPKEEPSGRPRAQGKESLARLLPPNSHSKASNALFTAFPN